MEHNLVRARRAQRYGNLLAPGYKQACRPDIEAIGSMRNDVNVPRAEFASTLRLTDHREGEIRGRQTERIDAMLVQQINRVSIIVLIILSLAALLT